MRVYSNSAQLWILSHVLKHLLGISMELQNGSSFVSFGLAAWAEKLTAVCKGPGNHTRHWEACLVMEQLKGEKMLCLVAVREGA